MKPLEKRGRGNQASHSTPNTKNEKTTDEKPTGRAKEE